jgi:hypothetical protein
MTMERIGYGAGTRDGMTRPNVLRLLIGQAGPVGDLLEDEVAILEVNLDDATGQQIGRAFEALFAAGALDVYIVPIQMKKNRPGVLLTAIVGQERVAACEEALLTQTTTFGIRRHTCARRKLDRRIETVATKYGDIRIKLGLRGGLVCTAAPEYEDCAAAAKAHHVPLQDVIFETQAAWRRAHQTQGSL